jgi:phosphoesterase RecJ-like protein
VSARPDGPTEADWRAAVAAVRATPETAPVLLACHVNPDGDALGSMLAVGLGLVRLGYSGVVASFPRPFTVPETFDWLPGLALLEPPEQVPRRPALLITFDAASTDRLGPMADRITDTPTIMLDHHLSNPGFGDVLLLDPRAAATAVLAAGLLDRLGVDLDREIAECLYVALSSDTGSFRFDSTTPAVHALAAQFIEAGAAPGRISQRLFDSRPFGAIRLTGEVLARAVLEPAAAGGRGLVWSYATVDDLSRHQLAPSILEGLIEPIRGAQEADVACMLKEVTLAQWAVSLRSRGGTDVAKVAVELGGGGHRLAAGYTGCGALDAVLDQLRGALKQP